MEPFVVAPRFAQLLEELEPYVVADPAGRPALDLAPFGVPIAEARRYDATRADGPSFVDRLARLDAATFGAGDGALAMPRWVLFDCGAVPGLVVGLGARAHRLPERVRAHFGVEGAPDAFVPLSMWIAVRTLEEGAFFGHNLSSANVLFERPRWPGLALLTKLLGVRAARAATQVGATQWTSRSLGLHLRLGPLRLAAAEAPAHTIRETLVYRLVPTEQNLRRALAGDVAPAPEADLVIGRSDTRAQRALHAALEAGARWTLVGLTPEGGNDGGRALLARA